MNEIERKLDRLDGQSGWIIVLLIFVFACIVSLSETLLTISKKIDRLSEQSNVRPIEK